jgi:hypothetical protein
MMQLEIDERAERRHRLIFELRCDLIDWDLDPTKARGWPATISSLPGDGFFIAFFILRPHTKGGKSLCASLEAGDLVRYRFGFNVFNVRVGYRDKATGLLCVRAADIVCHHISPARLKSDHTDWGSIKYSAVQIAGKTDDHGAGQ